MASSSIAVPAALILCILVAHAHGCYAKHHAAPSAANSSWLDAKATWYGARHGAGPDDNGGACGFKNVNRYPFMAMTSCGNEPLFKDGKGCGSCYQVSYFCRYCSCLTLTVEC